MITDWTSMFPPDSDEYWPELQQQIDHWEQRTSDDPGMFNQLVFGLMVAEHRAEAAEAVLANIPMAPLLRFVEAVLMRGQPLQFDVDAVEKWIKTPLARV